MMWMSYEAGFQCLNFLVQKLHQYWMTDGHSWSTSHWLVSVCQEQGPMKQIGSKVCLWDLTSKFVPSGKVCHEGTNSTMWSLTERSHSISLRHLVRRSSASGSSLQSSPKREAGTTSTPKSHFWTKTSYKQTGDQNILIHGLQTAYIIITVCCFIIDTHCWINANATHNPSIGFQWPNRMLPAVHQLHTDLLKVF
jgi:hypothetical protein